jgi:hypothetical protein
VEINLPGLIFKVEIFVVNRSTKMTDVKALLEVYRLAYHQAQTPEDKEALDVMRRYIETNFPLVNRETLWEIEG